MNPLVNWGPILLMSDGGNYTVDRLLSRIEHLGYRVHLEPVAAPAA